MEVKSESEVAQSCPTLSDPMDCSLPGSSVHGIFQARVLEWGAIAFSEMKWLGRSKSYFFVPHHLPSLLTQHWLDIEAEESLWWSGSVPVVLSLSDVEFLASTDVEKGN